MERRHLALGSSGDVLSRELMADLKEAVLEVLEENSSCCCDDPQDRARLAVALVFRVQNWIIEDKIRRLNALIDESLKEQKKVGVRGKA
jgi:hypothetical protein